MQDREVVIEFEFSEWRVHRSRGIEADDTGEKIEHGADIDWLASLVGFGRHGSASGQCRAKVTRQSPLSSWSAT